MKTLYKKELNYYLNNPIGYIVIILFAVFTNFLFIKDLFLVGSASLRPFFGVAPWILMVFVPAVAMRSIAEEKRIGTIETLLTLPISETQIVLAKFLALLTLIGIGLVLTLGLPLVLAYLVRLYIPELLVGYVGVLLLAASFLSMSIFFSSLTKNQVIAFLFSLLMLFLLLVMSTDFAASVLPRFIQEALVYFSPLYHLESFTKGIIDLRSIVYFLSFVGLFLTLTVIDLERRD
ncbi:ABC transporter permease subunit [Candidatus Roizmanbacteria bacterium]|nr:ABC transporter permease subunit [Candidatus Roizmanbacteria bacterium]